ncbi:MAG: hypothetical protein PWQ57_3004 [Desulfovibrionales bacterium]|nr:hypothetical protein [Desulfovibrionales bacterium]
MRERWWSIFLALALAVFSWYHITGREQVETVIEMPVEMINPPKGMTILSGMVNRISVRVRGPKGLVRTLTNKAMAYPLDASKLKVGENVIAFHEDSIPISHTLEIVEIAPSRAKIEVDKLVERQLPVQVQFVGDLGPDLLLAEKAAQPSTVTVSGPAKLISPLEFVPTLPVKRDADAPAAWDDNVELDPPADVGVKPSTVHVALRFEYERRSLWAKTPLDITPPKGFKIRAARSSVRLLIDGPVPFFREKNFQSRIKAQLLLPQILEPGNVSLLYRVVLPESCHLVQAEPVRVDVRISKR